MTEIAMVDYDSAVHALKTGIAVVLCALSICDPIYSFTATGGWAAVTVIVLSQRTVGATMLKFTERTLARRPLPPAASSVGWRSTAICRISAAAGAASLLFVVTVYCIYRADTGRGRAYTMTALTFNFLLLLCYRQPELAARRAVAHDCHRRPHHYRPGGAAAAHAHEKARASRILRGRRARDPNRRRRRRLRPAAARSRVELAPAALDDEIHVAYRQVVLARTTIDEATKAAPWERGCSRAASTGRGTRSSRGCAARSTTSSIDGFLRVDQPRHSPPSEAFRRTLAPRLLAATERMAAVLATFATAVKTLDGVEADRVAAGAGLEAMEQSLALLRKGLREYVAAVSPEVARSPTRRRCSRRRPPRPPRTAPPRCTHSPRRSPSCGSSSTSATASAALRRR